MCHLYSKRIKKCFHKINLEISSHCNYYTKNRKTNQSLLTSRYYITIKCTNNGTTIKSTDNGTTIKCTNNGTTIKSTIA